jgi:endoglucanase
MNVESSVHLRFISRLFALALFIIGCGGDKSAPGEASAQTREPKGGLYPTSLVVFDGQLRNGFVVEGFNGGNASSDDYLQYNGKSTWRWDVSGAAGFNILWGGWTIDTTVFWLHENSHISCWVRPSNNRVQIFFSMGYMGDLVQVSDPAIVGREGEWRRMEVPVPRQLVGRPLNRIQVSTWEKGTGRSTIHVSDLKVSHVRLYAGLGEEDPFDNVVASQVGYDIDGIKTFSAGPYNYYEVVRIKDGVSVYKGTDGRKVVSKVFANRPVWVGDFTSFKAEGEYTIRLDNGKQSHPFKIGARVYDAPLRAATRFFYFQRNNTAIEMPFAEGPWVHEKDDKPVSLSDGRRKRVRHGWHDAGDFAIYMPNHAYACFWLALAWDDFRYNADDLNIPESGNGIPDVLDELRWGLDWILDMQDESDGGFHHNMCVDPKSNYDYGKTTQLTIRGYILTNKTTAATGSAVGVLAYAARLFQEAKLDPEFVSKMKNSAIRGWEYLQAHPEQINVTEGCQTYQDPDDIHARFFAASALFLLTGEDEYHRYLLEHDPGSTWVSDFNNQTNLGYLLYLKSSKTDSKKVMEIKDMIVHRSREAIEDRVRHPFGFIGYYYWGSLGTAFARSGNYCVPDWLLNGNRLAMFTALQQLHYTFGQNSLGLSYVSGIGRHSLQGGFHHWLQVLNATPRNFPGMLAGGPNENPDPGEKSFPNAYHKPSDTPLDSRFWDGDSWSTNEVAVNQNAQLVYILAAAWDYALGREPKPTR